MPYGPELMIVADTVFGEEVFVADADVLLGDACDVLESGQRSELLRAIDTGTAIALMSERAFHELGWMSAKSARGRKVNHDHLRALLTQKYLPRIPVVATPESASEHWMPAATDVADPHDVAHVQVARLVSARAVYSHDRHLRRPGHAPATRNDYDQRVISLSVVSKRKETEQGAGMILGLASTGTSSAVSWTSARINIRPAAVWAGLAAVLVVSTYLILARPDRRQRLLDGLTPTIERIGAALERSEKARRELSSTSLLTTVDHDRFEVLVATWLARNPDTTMGGIAESLELTTAGRRQLSALLRSHPSFERVSRYGWAIGRTRTELETVPPPWPSNQGSMTVSSPTA